MKPDDEGAWSNLGVLKSKMDDKDGAIVAFKRALAIDPNSARSHFNLATVYRRQRDIDKAIAEDELAVRYDPKLAAAYYDLGILYSQERRTDDAAGAFRKYLEVGVNEDAPSRADAEERLKGLAPPAAAGDKAGRSGKTSKVSKKK
jgi:tetratricopeptide (TPR) repeat protein